MMWRDLVAVDFPEASSQQDFPYCRPAPASLWGGGRHCGREGLEKTAEGSSQCAPPHNGCLNPFCYCLAFVGFSLGTGN